MARIAAIAYLLCASGVVSVVAAKRKISGPVQWAAVVIWNLAGAGLALGALL